MSRPILVTGSGFVGSALVWSSYGCGKSGLFGLFARLQGNLDFVSSFPDDKAFVLSKAGQINARDLAQNACAAGAGASLAWAAGEILDRGPAAKKHGLALIREIVAAHPDDVTSTVVALLSDLHPRDVAQLPQIHARSLDPSTVVITTSILRHAEFALAEAVATTRRTRGAFDDLLQWTGDKSPLVRWVATAGAQIVAKQVARDQCNEIMEKILETIEQPRGSLFVATRLLHPLWKKHRFEMSRVAASVVRKLNAGARECLVASAVDSLQRRQLPRFVKHENRVVYVPPPRDPWPRFGKALARLASGDDTLWSLLQR